MAINSNSVSFYSGDQIDKIIVEDSVSYSLAGSGTATPNSTTQSIPNPAGVKGVVSAVFSVDGTNFVDQDTQIGYYNSSLKQLLTKAAISVGCSDSTIYFFLMNGYTSTLTFTIKFTVASLS